ncbi:hypothetical protein RYX36_002639 [Vicia faba]
MQKRFAEEGMRGGNKVEMPFSQKDREKLQGERAVEFKEVNIGSTAFREFTDDQVHQNPAISQMMHQVCPIFLSYWTS